MDRVLMLVLACLGAVCMIVGYRLFCDLPVMRRQGPGTNWAAVILLNIVPGALLALLGAGLFATEARAMLAHHSPARHQSQGAEGTSWHRQHPRVFDHAA